jgi:ribonuclease PH
MATNAKKKDGSDIGPLIRSDGRLPDECREVKAHLDYIQTAPGSCLFEMGNTRVLCTASVDEKVPPHKRGSEEGWVTAEYSMLPGSGTSRVPRSHSRSGRTMEIQRLIGRSMRAVVDLSLLGERTVYIDCDVLQADGGTRCASITGGYLALCRAVDTLMKTGGLEQNPLIGSVAAVSVGLIGTTPILDLDYGEDVEAEVDMNIVMTGEGRFVEVQGTAEGEPFKKSEMNNLIALAEKGIAQLIELQVRYLDGA